MKPIKILLIEDNDGDILLTKEALENKNFKSELEVAKNGSLAIEYLEKIILDKTEKLPQLILLDINLPKKTDRKF
jgi:CheY-like chemotaxis protein